MKSSAIIISIFLIIAILLLFIKITGFANFTSINICQDTDTGNDILTKGSVSGSTYTSYSSNKTTFNYEDKCENDKTLIEYYCSSNTIESNYKSQAYKCLDGCSDGTCINNNAKKCSFFCRIFN